MGLVNVGSSLLSGAARLLGIGGTATGAGAGITGALTRLAPTIGRAAPIGAAIGGGLGLLSDLFGGDSGRAQGIAEQIRASGRSQFVTLDDGSSVLVSPSGRVARPQKFLPAGAKLPAGATVVSVSPNRDLFGIRVKRRRKKFAGEMTQVRDVIKAADDIQRICKRK